MTIADPSTSQQSHGESYALGTPTMLASERPGPDGPADWLAKAAVGLMILLVVGMGALNAASVLDDGRMLFQGPPPPASLATTAGLLLDASPCWATRSGGRQQRMKVETGAGPVELVTPCVMGQLPFDERRIHRVTIHSDTRAFAGGAIYEITLNGATLKSYSDSAAGKQRGIGVVFVCGLLAVGAAAFVLLVWTKRFPGTRGR